MPNWCFNNITIKTKDEKTAEALFKNIEEWTSKEFVPSDFGKMWLGNILGNSGIDKDPGHSDVHCRGRICDYDIQGDTVTLQTESAWDPAISMWFLLIDEMYPGSEVTYTAEESSCDIYWTNDKEVDGTYIIDSSNDELESEWEVSKENTVKILQKFLSTDESDIEKLIDLAEEEDVNVHKYEFVNDPDLL